MVLALLRGSRRERAGLALCVVVAGAITVAVSVFQLRTGYGAQGRHALPALVLPRSTPARCCAGASARGWP